MKSTYNPIHYLNDHSDLIAGSEATVVCHHFLIIIQRLSLHEEPLAQEQEETLRTSMNYIKKKWDSLQWNPAVRSHGIKLLQTWSLYKLSHRLPDVNREQIEATLHKSLQRICNDTLFDPLMELTRIIHALITPSEPNQTTWAITRDHLILKQKKWNVRKSPKKKYAPHNRRLLLVSFICAFVITGYAYNNYTRFQTLLSAYGQES